VRTLPSIAVSLWLGAMAFFALVVAPAAFTTLERDTAARFVTTVFPRYYAIGMALGVVALVGIGGGLQRGARGGDWLALALVLLMLALTAYAWRVVLPAAHAAREAMRQGGGPPSTEALRFARLHRLSSILNVTVMMAGLALLVTQAARRP
jgi:Domain of unknown function (DUF4149)